MKEFFESFAYVVSVLAGLVTIIEGINKGLKYFTKQAKKKPSKVKRQKRK